MSDARIVIADWITKAEWENNFENSHGMSTNDHADAILAALAEAGLVIVPREPTEKMIDAPRSLLLFEGAPQAGWTLGQHMDHSVREIRLTDAERELTYVNKATRAALVWRAMVEAANEQ